MRERLVVIDDQISPALVQELCGKKIETWRIEDGVCVPDRSPIHTRSHGTVCAALAGEFLPEMELVGISTGGNGGAQVENVCAALEWCLQDGAAVVCMSMGVTCGLDLARMETATRALRQAGCWVFCASSNGGKLTFPAAYPWTVGVKFDPTAREVQQVDPRWGCDVAVGLFQSQVLDKLAEEEPFFHARTNSLAVAMAASQVLQAGGVDHLPVKSQKLWVPDGNKAFQGWEKPVVRLLHSRGKWEALLEEFSRQSYWPVLLSDQVETDWSKMAARVCCLEEAAALLPQLVETAILFLEVPEGSPAVWDYQLDLAQMEPKEACRKVLGFFGEEE